MLKRLMLSKTFYTSIGAIVMAAGAAMKGLTSWDVAMNAMLTAVLAIFIRDGVAKSGPAQP